MTQLGVCANHSLGTIPSTVRCAYSGGTASGRNFGSLAVNLLRARMSGFGPGAADLCVAASWQLSGVDR